LRDCWRCRERGGGEGDNRPNELDAAILDVNLDGRRSFGTAHLLQQKNVPFIFATGYGLAGVPEEFAAVALLTKPFTEEQVANVLAQVTGRG
jgi:CheY-like chemotaxis protein